MTLFKRAIALGLCAALSIGLTACHVGADTAWIAEMNGEQIPAGVYLETMMTQYSAAVTRLTEDGSEAPKKPLDAELDGKKVSQVVAEEARKELNSYLAVEQKFAELELELTAEVLERSMMNASTFWPYIEADYKANGISQASFEQIALNQEKRSALFRSIYGEGGERAVPVKELQDKFYADFAKIIMIPLELSSAEDPAEKAEADQKTRAVIDGYYNRVVEGADMEDVVFEARKDASSDPESVEKPAAGASFSFVNKEEKPYDDKVMDAIFAAEVGKPVKIETEDMAYMFVRYDIAQDPKDFENAKESLLYALKFEEFESLVEEWGAALAGVTINEEAISRYTPDKLKIKF